MIDESMFGTLKVLYHTFGCKLNFAETSAVAQILRQRGFVRAQGDDVPDIIVVNTCSVTELADKKCRQTIRSFGRRFPDAGIVVTGCYAQLKPDEVASLPGVAVVAGSNQKGMLAEYVDRWMADRRQITDVPAAKDIRTFVPSCSRGDRTRYFLKVQDGCDYFCSYCTIPYARGRSRSATVAQIVEQAQDAAASGGKEIVLTGVNVGDFGKGTDEDFFALIRALDDVEGVERYRISSIEPNLLSEDIIRWVAQSRKFMPHFHIPLQCGDDEVLKLMRRHYDTALFRSRIELINKVMPDAFIGVDLIVGARGETPERFENSRRFVESLGISRLHVFPYSERPGTRALEIDGIVSQEEKHRRTHVMLNVSDRKLEDFSRRFIGTERKVLAEHKSVEGVMHGFTDNYLKVALPDNPEVYNKIVNVRLMDFKGEEMIGEVVI